MIVYHLPMLAISEGASASMLDGEVRRFLIDEFANIDPDWAHDNYFVASTAVWVTEGSAADSERDDELVLLADLIRLAATAVLEAPLASPRLTIRYFGLGQDSHRRIIGPFERTLLLSDHSIATADLAALERIGGLAKSWHAAGYDADHPAFGALGAFGAVYTSLNARPELRMMPTMVALEGIFAPENAPAIARRMTATLSALLASEPALTASIRQLYDIRSDIIHGRSLKDDANEAMGSVGAIACRATLAVMDRLVRGKVPPNRWTDVLEARS